MQISQKMSPLKGDSDINCDLILRIDKYIWSIRAFKTRSLATEACKSGRVTVAEKECKPSRAIKVGEEIVIRKGAIHFAWRVLDIPKSRVGAKLVPNYATETTTAEELEKFEMVKLSYRETFRRKPGRPTKKDRRDLDKYFE